MTAEASDRPLRVLVVEDEEPIREGLLTLLRQQGLEPEGVVDGAQGLERIATGSYDLVVLDLLLPGMHGLEVLRRARAEGNEVPVLVLTACGQEDDIVAGLEAGADDYVTKPFGIRELVARAQGLLRRARLSPDTPRRFVVAGAAIDLDELSVSWDGGKLRLTAREGMLLGYLATRRHRPVSREELLVDVWGYRDGTIRTRTVDVHVQQLRAKLKKVPGGADWVSTIRGRGYRFVAEVG